MTSITITPIQCAAKELNPAQKRFNNLTKGLQQDKALLKKWMETHSQLKIEFARKIIPLSQEIETLRLNLLILLDKNYTDKALTAIQKEKLYAFIQHLADTCLSFDETGIAEEIHDRYNDVSAAEISQANNTALKDEIEMLFGVDLGDDFDFHSEAAFADFVGKVNEREESAAFKQKREQKAPKAKKKSNNEIIESQSIKEVFRQLTKVLHPDREMDEVKRVKKSELMQRANIAYKKNDLLSLLELQFEIEQIEQKNLDNLATEKLLAYNRMLQSQRKQIKEEIQLLKYRIGHELDLPPFYQTPDDALFYFNNEVVQLHATKSQMTEDLNNFSDIKSLKQWLNSFKKSRLPPKDLDIVDEFMADIFNF